MSDPQLLAVWNDDALFLVRIWPIQQCHISDTLYQHSGTGLAKSFDDVISCPSVTNAYTYLDQFVVCQRCFKFGEQGLCRT